MRKSHVLMGGQQVWVASKIAQVSQRYWMVLLPGIRTLLGDGRREYTAITGSTHICRIEKLSVGLAAYSIWTGTSPVGRLVSAGRHSL